MARRITIEGLRELDRALGELPKATAKNVLRRVGRKALEPVARDAEARAPVLSGQLKIEIGVGTRLTRRQAALHRRATRGAGKAFVEVFAGVGRSVPQGHLREFGGDGAPPHPYMRPSWDANKMRVLESIKDDLAEEIRKAAERLARRRARGTAGSGS